MLAKIQNIPHIHSNSSEKSTSFNTEGLETPSITCSLQTSSRRNKRATLYDQEEFERGVKAVMKGKFLVKSTHEAIEMLIDQQTLLGSIPLDAMRNNSSKLVNQNMDVVPLEEMNLYAECILRQVAENMHDSKLMSRYVEELTKKDREKWQQYHLNDTMTLTSLTFFTLGRVQASLTLLSLTQKVPLGDGLYADLCLVSHLGYQ